MICFSSLSFLPSPEREAIRREKMKAKTNNQASQPGGFFFG
jgi:chorismate mutase/prephenate dehydratase